MEEMAVTFCYTGPTYPMHRYNTLYRDLDFERAGLFEALREKYPCREVLYPGCSVHLTPSLYFPHVVYVDRSEEAARFFASGNTLQDFVNRNKRYRQSCYLQFIQQDYQRPLPLKEGSFDLLLALYADGIVSSCIRYLKPGGHLISNNHRGEAELAVKDRRLKLVSAVLLKKGKTIVAKENLREDQISSHKFNSRVLTDQGTKIVERETYFVFQRLP